MEFPAPRLKGFAIELPLFKYAVNVQDGNKQFVTGANVQVTGTNFLETGLTDGRGCYFGSAELHKLYTITISKSGFTTWTHQFTLVLTNELSHPGQNFPVIVRDSSNVPISGASVSITSPMPHSDSGTTDSNGLYEGLVEKDYLNTIAISKSGYQTYNNVFSNYVKIACLDQTFAVIPIITLNP